MICKDCGIQMIGVMSFSKDKREKFCQCPKCRGETKHIPIYESELNFREALRKEIQKSKRK